MFYALAVYIACRKGSLYEIRWRDVDFVNGTLTVRKTKTGRPRFFVADESLMFLLRLWHERSGRPDGHQPVVSNVCEACREAKTLRADLQLAGITRGVLFAEDPTIEPLRFHDKRATFTTWARRAECSDAWIEERTGHQSKEMMDRYTRAAQTFADLRYEPFPEISGAVPELVPLAQRLAQCLLWLLPIRPNPQQLQWSGRVDSNHRPLDPQSSALTRLRYAPNRHP